MPPERDPRKSIRNKEIKALTEKINEQLPNVLKGSIPLWQKD
jgi:hypothetical protein